MTEQPDIGTGNHKPGSSTAIIYVSLYFLLLAFFIYLHSISAPTEEKVKQVIGSIDFAFKGIKQQEKLVKAKELSGDEMGLAAFHAQLKRVYETAIPLIESKVNQKGDELQFALPASQLFASGSPTLRETRNELFEDASRILIKRSGVAPTDMEILIDAGERLPSADQVASSIQAMRLTALVNSFLDSGVPARNIFVGMKSGKEDKIRFRFYIRERRENQFRREGADQ